MTVQVLRDIIIIVGGIIFTISLILVLFMTFSVYKKLRAIFALTADSLIEIRKLINEAKDAIKPIMQIITIIEAAGKAIDLISKIFGMKQKGGQENGPGTVD